MIQTFLSLLRAINVSGQNPVRMAELKELYESCGLKNVVTYLQSGNVIFDSPETDPADIARTIHDGLASVFGMQIEVLIRTPIDMAALMAGNPFVNTRRKDFSKLHVTFLSEFPAEAALQGLRPPAGSLDEFIIIGREVFLYCPNGYGRTKLNNGFFERKLNLPATTRSWKTVTSLNDTIAGREK